LQDLKGNGYDFWVSGVKCGLDGDNQLWNYGEHLGTALVEHVEHSLDSEESVWINFFANTLEKDWQVMVIV